MVSRHRLKCERERNFLAEKAFSESFFFTTFHEGAWQRVTRLLLCTTDSLTRLFSSCFPTVGGPILFVSASNNEIETREEDSFRGNAFDVQRGGKTGGGGWKLDYLKFRGNYEGNYGGNLFLDPIVHRGERSTIRSSRKTSATKEIGVLAHRSILRSESSLKSSRWPRAKFILDDLVKIATASLRDCYVIRFVLRLSPLLVQQKLFITYADLFWEQLFYLLDLPSG